MQCIFCKGRNYWNSETLYDSEFVFSFLTSVGCDFSTNITIADLHAQYISPCILCLPLCLVTCENLYGLLNRIIFWDKYQTKMFRLCARVVKQKSSWFSICYFAAMGGGGFFRKSINFCLTKPLSMDWWWSLFWLWFNLFSDIGWQYWCQKEFGYE